MRISSSLEGKNMSSFVFCELFPAEEKHAISNTKNISNVQREEEDIKQHNQNLASLKQKAKWLAVVTKTSVDVLLFSQDTLSNSEDLTSNFGFLSTCRDLTIPPNPIDIIINICCQYLLEDEHHK